MSYCINPKCSERENQNNAQKCQKCSTSLLIQATHRYRIIKRLNHNPSTCTEIFEVEDLDHSNGNRLKIIKAIHDNDTYYDDGKRLFDLLTRLFEREQRFLYYNRHSGIPNGYDFFTFRLSSGEELHCLVMENIEGQNLEQWVESQGAIKEKLAIRWLKQIVEILDFVHTEAEFFHRDIKPSNIMWRSSDNNLLLIDFGAVKQIDGTIIEQNGKRLTTNIWTPGYVAPEQRSGNPSSKSDFYALGRTFVYLLTGKAPQEIEEISKWHESTKVPISESLIKLINKLMEESPNARPRDAKEILVSLSKIEKEIARKSTKNRQTLGSAKMNIIIVSGSVLAVLITLFAGQNNKYSTPFNLPSKFFLSEACSNLKIGDQISCGEESVTSQINKNKDLPQDKAQGMGEIKDGNYTKAEELLEKAWKQTFEDKEPDPETLIYLNNAKIHNLNNQQNNPQKKIYTIAVAAPLKYIKEEPDIFNQGLEMLRGVAQAQNRAIEEGIYLQIAIVNDTNNREKVPEIAEQLGKSKDILGVIGHYSSSITKVALPKYQANELVLVSPASTSVKLSGENNFYRTVPDDAAAGKAIAEKLKNQPNLQKVAIFWSKNEQFSESLKGEAEKGLGSQNVVNYNIENSEIFNLASNQFNAENALNEAKKQEVTAIILIPDGGQTKALTNAYAVIQAANKDPNLIIIGADTLYNSRTIENVEKNAAKNQLLVAVSWHPLNNKQFSKFAEKLWRTKNVNWLTATTYDATLVLTEAIKQEPSREGIKKIISADDFKLNQGATGEIRFNRSDRANPQITLVKVLPNCKAEGHRFVPDNYGKDCVLE